MCVFVKATHIGNGAINQQLKHTDSTLIFHRIDEIYLNRKRIPKRNERTTPRTFPILPRKRKKEEMKTTHAQPL
jgi:hypothetical protein